VEQFFIPPDAAKEVNTYDETDPDEKKKLDYLKSNSLAYSILTLSQNDTVILNAISSSKTVDLPNGYAWKAWDNLKALYAPSNHGTKKLDTEIQSFNLT
jgi:hypothetical protein